MPDDGAPSVYRDGQHAAHARFRERRRQIEALAASLRAEGWSALPRRWRRDLDRLALSVRDPRPDLDAIAAEERALEAYAERLEDALALAAHLRAGRERDAPQRQRLARGAAAVVLAAAAGLGVWFHFEGRRYEAARVAFAAECRASRECSVGGRCEAGDAWLPNHFQCVAGSDADCAASRQCPEEGQCRRDRNICAALDDDACARSRACAERGNCVSRGDYWCHSDEAHCRARTACAAEGRCRPGTNQYGCTDVSGPDCRASAGCRDRGACSVVDYACAAAFEEDCRASTACLKRGACELLDGGCGRSTPAAPEGGAESP